MVTKSKIPLIVLGTCFIGVYLLLAVHPVAAFSSPWVKWKVNLAFPNNNTSEVWLTIQKGHTIAPGIHIIDAEERIELSCVVHGKAIVQNYKIIFNGNSYYQCSMPSIQEKAMDLWNMTIPDVCIGKHLYVVGQVTIEASPLDPYPENPIFFRDDIKFNMPLVVSTQEIVLDVEFDEIRARSDPFVLGSAEHQVLAYLPKPDPSSFFPHFHVDGIQIPTALGTLPQPAEISTLESEIYFGYSPLSGEYFEGKMGPVEADPVCPATG